MTILKTLVAAFLILVVNATAHAAPQPAILKTEFLYETAPFPTCHASTIAQSQVHLVAAYFGGTAEQNPDTAIYISRQENGQWLPPVEVANGVQSAKRRFPCWNPVLFQPKAGPLLLFYKVGSSPRSWWGMLTKSSDGGQTWEAPERLPKNFIGPVKNKPLQLGNGDILYPSSTEILGWQIHIEKTDASVQNWEGTKALNDSEKIRAIQPSLLNLGAGRVQAIGRTAQGKLFSLESLDAGQTWGPMTLLDLPNPNSGTDALTLRDGRQLLVYNHSDHLRSPLNIAVSTNGKNWTNVLTLEDTKGEFSYPAVIQTEDGLIHCTYTWNRTRIRHVVIDPTQLPMP
jgi:predicted neuraminidase